VTARIGREEEKSNEQKNKIQLWSLEWCFGKQDFPRGVKMSAPRFKVDHLSEAFVRLIDIMFALTITQGFVIYRDLIVNPVLSLEAATLVLVYATIFLSWIGYHTSISRYPYNKSAWSRCRLFLDIVILLLYAHLVFGVQNLQTVFLGLATVFIIYVINGIARIREWRDGKVSKPFLSFLFATAFLVEWYILESFHTVPYLSWILVFVGLALLIIYRIARAKLGYPALLVVGVDVDGVLGEQVPPALERIKAKGKGKDLSKSDITDWNFRIENTNISKEIEEYLLDPTFMIEMPVVSGSTSAMQKLHKSYHVVVATNRPLETQKSTIDWLKKHFKFHEFANTREVGKDKLGLDILIDDNLDNVKMFASSGGQALLFSQPWNQNVEDREFEEMIRTKKIIRCENWEDVLKSLSLSKDRKGN